ncbi:MAG TPA: T9SS type A sorting domain-containing protein, partial [Bacteroidetes bacterium]|nr:T9SS type A sorting domain-containing protein [Bacteroidota bacterium]
PLTQPKDLKLSVYPNPARGTVAVVWTVPKATRVRLDLFNTLGQKVASLAEDTFAERGRRPLRFDLSALRIERGAQRLPAGVYLLRLRAGSCVATAKVLYLP